MNDPNPQSITRWFEQLRRGNPDAATMLWDHFFDGLVAYSRQKMSSGSQGIVDGEDIAVGVMAALCSCAERGKLPSIESRDDLWRILLSWARHDIVDCARANKRLKRGGTKVRGESIFGKTSNGLDQVVGATVPADVIVELTEHWNHLFASLPNPTLRLVALKRIQGYSVQEIAAELAVTPRTVERKLQLIRTLWSPQPNA